MKTNGESNTKDLYYMTIRVSTTSRGDINQLDAALHKVTPTGRFKPFVDAESFNCNQLEKEIEQFYKKSVKDKQALLKVGLVFTEGYPLRETGYVNQARLQDHIENFSMEINRDSLNRDEKPFKKYAVFQSPPKESPFYEDEDGSIMYEDQWEEDNWSKQEYKLAGINKEVTRNINSIIKNNTPSNLSIITFKEDLENNNNVQNSLQPDKLQHLTLADRVKNDFEVLIELKKSNYKVNDKFKEGSFLSTYMTSNKEIKQTTKRSRTRTSGRGM